MKKLIKIYGLFLLVSVISSCTERDDYPDFSNVEPPKVIEDIIPPDNSILPITEKIKSGSSFFKTFLLDSAVKVLEGIEYNHIRFINNLDQKVSMHVVEMDKSKANISMTSLSPYDDYLFGVQVLPEMLLMNQESIPDVLQIGIVGDNHSSGTPTGSFVKKGRVLRTSTSRVLPYIGVKKGSSEILFLNSPDATKYPVAAIVPSEYSSLVAGQNWLLYNDVEIVSTAVTALARTAIGVSKDKSKFYCISVDGINDFSAGIGLNNLRTLFKALGCSSAFFTNGSASNSLAIRTSNEKSPFVLKNFPQSGLPTSIANGIGFVVKK